MGMPQRRGYCSSRLSELKPRVALEEQTLSKAMDHLAKWNDIFYQHELQGLPAPDAYEAAEQGSLEPLPGRRAVSRVGDLFELGPHRVACGDSSDPEVVRTLMQTDVARLIFTDEPFNVAIGGHVTGGEHREFVTASGEMTDAQFLDFNRRWISALLPYLVDGGVFGTFIDWRGLPIVHSAATELGLTPLQSDRLGEDQRRHG